ncbi:VWA domain-containing protein [Sphaerisporangium sp. NPDC051011]|uniref:VWA domain-containing protein n=1 Tax=Sphaerisporangium sp. NPDC051011 TaxID=3155792 RepID=UPI0033FD82D3
MKKPKFSKLKDLAARAGRWLGLAAQATPTPHTLAVEADRFDTMTWADTLGQAAALQHLAHDLAEKHDHTTDLLQDVWTAAYKTSPHLRGRDEMDPSRVVNHQVMTSLLGSAEFEELRRNTTGDPYAAAMAVLSQADALRGMLEQGKEAQQAAQQAAAAKTAADQAAAAVQAALEAACAAASEDGQVPEAAGQQVAAAIAAAEAAGQADDQAAAAAQAAIAAAAPGIRSAARASAHKAAQEAQQEAEMMAAWGVGPGQLQRLPFAERAALAQRLAGSRLAQFAKLIGRFRTMAAGERARRVQHAGGEYVGVTLGDDLSRLVPSELAALAVPALRAEFASRLAEGRLMVYDTQGEENAGSGTIVALIDCSSSMEDTDVGGITREAWAKACALALLDQARATSRDFVAILFASEERQQQFCFPRGQAGITEVIDFAEHFFGGGTSFSEPLDQAADLLADSWDADHVRHGDVVLITDGECRVTGEWLEGWRRRKDAIGFRVFGVSIAQRPGRVLEELCDNLRHVTDLADVDSSRDLFRAI